MTQLFVNVVIPGQIICRLATSLKRFFLPWFIVDTYKMSAAIPGSRGISSTGGVDQSTQQSDT